MKLSGAKIVLNILMEQGVDVVFGYPGGANLNVYDELYNSQGEIRHILTSHEQHAAHAADGYARATGRTGVVMATSGPGATNLVTGLATAFLDSIPMVAITCNVPGSMIGSDAFQEVHITGITMPITKHNYFVNKVEDLADALRGAFRIAASGRKGPVLVDITKDVTAALAEFEPQSPIKKLPLPKATHQQVAEVAELINNAKRPVAYFGGGVAISGAGKVLTELLDKGDIPGTYTLMAAGVISYDDDKNLGLIGMHGSVASNRAVDKADLVLALGTRFSDRVAINMNKFAKDATIVQVDIDRSEINKNILIDKSIVGDVKDFLEQLLPHIEKRERSEWIQTVSEWQTHKKNTKIQDGKLHPQQIIESTCDLVDRPTIYVTDVGQHQMWAAQYLKHKNTKSFVTSGGLGTMGFGYGAAIGAQLGCPENRVVHFTGDASFHMNLAEACTAVSHKLPIITIIVNNTTLGMVYQLQNVYCKARHFATTPQRQTDFAKIAEGFGGVGLRAATPQEFEEAFKKALSCDGPVWIDCKISYDEMVLPMIPNGGTVKEMIID